MIHGLLLLLGCGAAYAVAEKLDKGKSNETTTHDVSGGGSHDHNRQSRSTDSQHNGPGRVKTASTKKDTNNETVSSTRGNSTGHDSRDKPDSAARNSKTQRVKTKTEKTGDNDNARNENDITDGGGDSGNNVSAEHGSGKKSGGPKADKGPVSS